MVVGESGLGKTTFINTLFSTDITENKEQKEISALKTVTIKPSTFELVEDGVILYLTVIDSPGFGDQLNRESNFDPIINYIDAQYDKYFAAEKSQQIRQSIPDTRVHCLLYFLPPGGNRLRELDLEFLQRLSSKVNVIPVIAKADSLAPEEAAAYKQAILRDMATYDIRVYPNHHAEDRDFIPAIEQYIPFTVIGSDTFVKVGGKDVRARKYRWGTVEVENPQHCDFIHLREMLIRTNMQDLIDTTHITHYSQYRGSKIRGKGRPESFLACDELYESRIDNAKRNLQEDMQRREDEMRQRFVGKVREKEQSLRDREDALNATRQKMMEELESLRRAVEQEENAVNELAALKGKSGLMSPRK